MKNAKTKPKIREKNNKMLQLQYVLPIMRIEYTSGVKQNDWMLHFAAFWFLVAKTKLGKLYRA